METKTTEEQIKLIAKNGNTQKFHIDSLIHMNKEKWVKVDDVRKKLFDSLSITDNDKFTDYIVNLVNELSQSNPSTHNKAIVTEKLSNPSLHSCSEGRDTLNMTCFKCGKGISQVMSVHNKDHHIYCIPCNNKVFRS